MKIGLYLDTVSMHILKRGLFVSCEPVDNIEKYQPGLVDERLSEVGQYFLVCVESSKRLPINQFRKLIWVKDLSFATPEDMKKILNLTPGSVSLFWLVCQPTHLQLYLDHDLREVPKVWRHPNRNDATIMIDHKNLEKFLNAIWVKAVIVKIAEELKLC